MPLLYSSLACSSREANESPPNIWAKEATGSISIAIATDIILFRILLQLAIIRSKLSYFF